MSALNGNGNGVEKLDGGRPINRAVTPGGHQLDNSQPALYVSIAMLA